LIVGDDGDEVVAGLRVRESKQLQQQGCSQSNASFHKNLLVVNVFLPGSHTKKHEES
jgi:hypothetical protein